MRALAVTALAALALALPAAPASACAGSEPCDTLNRLCDKVAGPCLP